jgi:hypothetical protein
MALKKYGTWKRGKFRPGMTVKHESPQVSQLERKMQLDQEIISKNSKRAQYYSTVLQGAGLTRAQDAKKAIITAVEMTKEFANEQGIEWK